jgi:hypothetical protein
MLRKKDKNRIELKKRTANVQRGLTKAWYLRENKRRNISVKTIIVRVVAGRDIEGVFR